MYSCTAAVALPQTSDSHQCFNTASCCNNQALECAFVHLVRPLFSCSTMSFRVARDFLRPEGTATTARGRLIIGGPSTSSCVHAVNMLDVFDLPTTILLNFVSPIVMVIVSPHSTGSMAQPAGKSPDASVNKNLVSQDSSLSTNSLETDAAPGQHRQRLPPDHTVHMPDVPYNEVSRHLIPFTWSVACELKSSEGAKRVIRSNEVIQYHSF